MFSKKEAYDVGFEHGFEMAQESGSSCAGGDGWDSILINADPSYARENFGWDGCDSSEEAKELLAEYCRGAQDGANSAIEEDDSDELREKISDAVLAADVCCEEAVCDACLAVAKFGGDWRAELAKAKANDSAERKALRINE
jgi:hypothetical protein